ncbi:hypothetical protein ADUPG1_010552, partial [Aduncisulcus paluster]
QNKLCGVTDEIFKPFFTLSDSITITTGNEPISTAIDQDDAYCGYCSGSTPSVDPSSNVVCKEVWSGEYHTDCAIFSYRDYSNSGSGSGSGEPLTCVNFGSEVDTSSLTCLSGVESNPNTQCIGVYNESEGSVSIESGCVEGWYGDECLDECPLSSTNFDFNSSSDTAYVCGSSTQGYCNINTHICECTDGWYGLSCFSQYPVTSESSDTILIEYICGVNYSSDPSSSYSDYGIYSSDTDTYWCDCSSYGLITDASTSTCIDPATHPEYKDIAGNDTACLTCGTTTDSHGTCVLGEGEDSLTAMCQCEYGWGNDVDDSSEPSSSCSVDMCGVSKESFDIDDATSVCSKHGTCLASDESPTSSFLPLFLYYSCKCADGWQGVHCSTEIIDDPANNGFNFIYLIIGISLLLIIGVILLCVLSQRKKKRHQNEEVEKKEATENDINSEISQKTQDRYPHGDPMECSDLDVHEHVDGEQVIPVIPKVFTEIDGSAAESPRLMILDDLEKGEGGEEMDETSKVGTVRIERRRRRIKKGKGKGKVLRMKEVLEPLSLSDESKKKKKKTKRHSKQSKKEERSKHHSSKHDHHSKRHNSSHSTSDGTIHKSLSEEYTSSHHFSMSDSEHFSMESSVSQQLEEEQLIVKKEPKIVKRVRRKKKVKGKSSELEKKLKRSKSGGSSSFSFSEKHESILSVKKKKKIAKKKKGMKTIVVPSMDITEIEGTPSLPNPKTQESQISQISQESPKKYSPKKYSPLIEIEVKKKEEVKRKIRRVKKKKENGEKKEKREKKEKKEKKKIVFSELTDRRDKKMYLRIPIKIQGYRVRTLVVQIPCSS